MNTILKIARNSNSETVWEALYIKGKKQVEASVLDKNKLCDIFGIKIDKEVFIYEEYADNITNSFPSQEDFSYLMDYTELLVGNLIYMEDGLQTVNKTWQFYRPRGVYKTVEWLPVLNRESPNSMKYIKIEQQRYYIAHWVTMFSVEGKQVEYIWDDIYNNNQSSLYKQYLMNIESKVNI